MLFSEYLCQKRELLGISQNDLVNNLQQYSILFKNIDAVTISRWETNKTLPRLGRQALILQYFNDLKMLPSLENSSAQKNAKKTFELLLKRYSLHHNLADSPYLTDLAKWSLEKANETITLNVEDLCLHLESSNTKEQVSFIVDSLVNGNNIRYSEFFNSDNSIAGHQLILKLKINDLINNATTIIKRKITQSELNAYTKIKCDKFDSVMLLPFGYASSLELSLILQISIYHYLITNNNISMIIKITNNDIINTLISNLDSNVISTGPQTKLGGVNFRGKKHSWACSISTPSDFLSNPFIMELVKDISFIHEISSVELASALPRLIKHVQQFISSYE